MVQKRRNYIKILGFKGLCWMVGVLKTRKSPKKRSRTQQTYQKKLTKLQTRYKKLYKSGKSNENKRNFCRKYPSFEEFLKKNILKRPEREVKSKLSTSMTSFKRKGTWF